MRPAFCARCNPPAPRVARPTLRSDPSPHGARAVDAGEVVRAGIAVIHSVGKARTQRSLASLTPDVTFVHFNGYPYKHVIRTVLDRCPNLQVVQVIPTALRNVGDEARGWLAARGVDLRSGHVRPEMAWAGERIIGVTYEPRRRFMLSLAGDQRVRWDEIVAMRFTCALVTARYLCLGDEPFVPLREVALLLDYNGRAESLMSAMVSTVIRYLDPEHEVSPDTLPRVANLYRSVERLRPVLASAAEQVRVARELGLERLPADLPLAKLEALTAVVRARQLGRFEALDERDRDVVTLRFGLGSDQRCWTFPEIAAKYRLTKQRMQQVEARAMARLGVRDDDAA